MLPEFAVLTVKVLQARIERTEGYDLSRYPPTLKVSLGHQKYKETGTVESLPALPFSLTLHAHLFYILQLDYYLTRKGFWGRREHVGRAQLRVRLLESIGTDGIVGWWELRRRDDCFLPLDELGKLPDDPRKVTTVGAVRLELRWSKLVGSPAATIRTPLMAAETVEKVAEAEATVKMGEPLVRSETPDSTLDASSSPRLILAAGQQVTGKDNIERVVGERVNEVLLDALSKPQTSTFAAVFQKMAGAFMSGDDYKAFLTIQALLLAFNQGIEVGGVKMTRAFVLLQRYFNRRAPLPLFDNHVSDNPSGCMRKRDFVLPRQLFRFVIASFGWLGITYTGKGKGLLDAMRPQADARTICEYLKLAEGDLLRTNFVSPGAFRPVYFVAYDRGMHAIVISIRGTMHASDALTDLVCDYVEWRQEDGYVHSGILAAAQWIFEQNRKLILETTSKRRVSNIYVTGHSLGGGTAVLLTILLLDQFKDQYNIRCAAFGSPPLVSQTLTRVYQDHIDIFINNEDGVPRLCYGSAVDLQCIMLYCAHISTDAWLFGEIPEQLCNNLDACRKVISERSRSLKLYHPGRVHLLSPVNSTTHIFKVPHDYFKELRITKRIIFDHLPDQYERTLDAAYVNYLMRELESRRTGNAQPLDLAGDDTGSQHSGKPNSSRSNSM